MKSKIKNNRIRRAFSMVEILAVLVIVSILIGLLIPALSAVQKMAANVRQKAQFTTIAVGLESYNTDFGDYPSSTQSCGGLSCANPNYYNGAQKLAEAMVGMDGYGFHKDSVFDHEGKDASGTVQLYDIDPANPIPDPPLYVVWDANLSRRKGPYLELEVANAAVVDNLRKLDGSKFDTNVVLGGLVLCDRFSTAKNVATGKKAGMPILYYKADTNASVWYNIYVSSHNSTFISGSPLNGPAFGAMIKNPNFTVNPRPYRSESYILISAGADGIYGTADDVTNFESE